MCRGAPLSGAPRHFAGGAVAGGFVSGGAGGGCGWGAAGAVTGASKVSRKGLAARGFVDLVTGETAGAAMARRKFVLEVPESRLMADLRVRWKSSRACD